MRTPLLSRIAALLAAVSVSISTYAQSRSDDDSVERTLKLLKAPSTPAEYWDAVKFSLNVGRHADAAMYIDKLLASDPPIELLITIRERDAADYFPKLAANPDLQQRAIELLRVTERAAQERARDPERIEKFIGYLTRSGQHRAYALVQLRNAGPDAISHLLSALRNPAQGQRSVILDSMQKLDSSALPPLVAALSASDTSLVADVVEVLGALGDLDTVPHLRYVAESREVTPALQLQARLAVERIVHVPYANLPTAVEALTAQAERYYLHRVELHASSAGTVRLWRWVEPEGLKSQQVSSSYAEEYLGMNLARQALTLNSKYEPAQIVLLSLALEKEAERVGIDQPLPEGPNHASAASLAAGPELLLKVAARAIEEGHSAVVLSALRSLSKVGDSNLLASHGGAPSPVIRALNMSDRRIQFAAAEAILSLRPEQPPPGAGTVMALLAQALGTEGTPRALIIDPDSSRAGNLTALATEAGYRARFVLNAADGLNQAVTTPDLDAIFIDANVYSPELTPAVAAFRSDPRTIGVPIYVLGEGPSVRPVDPLDLSLQRGEVDLALQMLRQFGDEVATSSIDAGSIASIQEQVDESIRVIRRAGRDIQLLPPSRVFFSVLQREIDLIAQRVRLAKTNDEVRETLLKATDQLHERVRRAASHQPGPNQVTARTVAYPGARALSKFERRYSRVRFMVRPESVEVLKLQLDSAAPTLQRTPLTAAERADQARRAAAWLARIALGEIRGLDVRAAESAIISALSDESIGPDAMVAASRIPSAAAQSALGRVVLSESTTPALRIEAARQMAFSLRRFGVLISTLDSTELYELLGRTTEPVFYQALAAITGSMKPHVSETGQQLLQLATPPFVRQAAPVAAPPVPGDVETNP